MCCCEAGSWLGSVEHHSVAKFHCLAFTRPKRPAQRLAVYRIPILSLIVYYVCGSTVLQTKSKVKTCVRMSGNPNSSASSFFKMSRCCNLGHWMARYAEAAAAAGYKLGAVALCSLPRFSIGCFCFHNGSCTMNEWRKSRERRMRFWDIYKSLSAQRIYKRASWFKLLLANAKVRETCLSLCCTPRVVDKIS
jgi:hypothetical protein